MTHHTSEEKEKLGAFFTEDYWADLLCEKARINERDTILDPTCGYGSLLKAAIKKGAKPENCFGTDIDPISIQRSGEIGANLKVGDALSNKSLSDAFWNNKFQFGLR